MCPLHFNAMRRQVPHARARGVCGAPARDGAAPQLVVGQAPPRDVRSAAAMMLAGLQEHPPLPPPTCRPLYRRFWHQAHWALWGNADLLHRSDGYYIDALPNASATAAYQGYDGARWPKMVLPAGNRGRGGLDTPWLGLAYDAHPFPEPWSAATAAPLFQWESNSGVGPLLVWQQPHVIWLADLQRRAANSTSGPAAAGEVTGRLVFVAAQGNALLPPPPTSCCSRGCRLPRPASFANGSISRVVPIPERLG